MNKLKLKVKIPKYTIKKQQEAIKKITLRQIEMEKQNAQQKKSKNDSLTQKTLN